jgi:hypothetical protein
VRSESTYPDRARSTPAPGAWRFRVRLPFSLPDGEDEARVACGLGREESSPSEGGDVVVKHVKWMLRALARCSGGC